MGCFQHIPQNLSVLKYCKLSRGHIEMGKVGIYLGLRLETVMAF